MSDSVLDPRFVRERLAALRAADPHLQRFGARKHRYRLGPPLREAQIQAFEQQYALQLPQDYRTFLLTVGNGGAGPSYGMASLQDLGWEGLQRPFTPPSTFAAFEEEDICEDGVLLLCDHGCEQYSALVVRGDEFGQMFLLAEGWTPETPRWTDLWLLHHRNWIAAVEALYGEYERLPRRTFSQWYRAWLEHV
ncbi:SMI1/KNR4 family protein [Deinococcus altitudinis]|uniref:SMI1/KNR4 family protein n=1 Tax=Deinococcus altitudinis TaxID=468914 RepID=UPI003891C7C5